MHINYELTQEDLLQFYLFHMQFDSKAKRAQRSQAILGCILIALASFFLIPKIDVSKVTAWAISFLIMFFFLAFYRAIFRSMVKKRVLRLLKKQDQDQEGSKSMTFEKDQLVETTGDRNLVLPYKDVYRSRENKDYFYIYKSPSLAYIIPKRCLSTKASEKIRQLLNL